MSAINGCINSIYCIFSMFQCPPGDLGSRGTEARCIEARGTEARGTEAMGDWTHLIEATVDWGHGGLSPGFWVKKLITNTICTVRVTFFLLSVCHALFHICSLSGWVFVLILDTSTWHVIVFNICIHQGQSLCHSMWCQEECSHPSVQFVVFGALVDSFLPC